MPGLVGLLGRGALAGAAAGVLSGGVSWLLAEPVIDRAVSLEEAHHAGDSHGAEVFTRGQQHVGLLVAAVATGLAIGLLYAVAYGLIHRRDPGADPWRRAMTLAGSGFLGVSLLPFLRYPANPPGVGDPATIGLRTGAWLAAIVIGLAVVAAAWQVHGRLRTAGEPARHLAVAGVLVAGTALLWLLPANPDPVDTPAEVIWPFRMLSLLAIALLWAALGAGFGLAGVRAARTEGAAAPSPTAA